MSFLGGDALQEVVEWNPRLGVGGGRDPWAVSHVARPADLIKSVIGPGTPINTPPADGIHTPHSICSSPLVNVPV
jgi:hypothetical protein